MSLSMLVSRLRNMVGYVVLCNETSAPPGGRVLLCFHTCRSHIVGAKSGLDVALLLFAVGGGREDRMKERTSLISSPLFLASLLSV